MNRRYRLERESAAPFTRLYNLLCPTVLLEVAC